MIRDKQRYSTLSPSDRWIHVKNRLIFLTKIFSKDMAQLRQEQLNYHFSILHSLARRLHNDPTILPRVKKAQAEVKHLYNAKLQGIVVRSRLPSPPGLSASLLHIKEDKRRQRQTFIQTYHDIHQQSHEAENIYSAILSDFRSYFQTAFDSQSSLIDFTSFLPSFPSGIAQQLLQPITIFELNEAISHLNSTASSGIDGLSPLWYKFFVSEISPYLCDMYNSFINEGVIPTHFGRIVGIVIPKNPKHISLNTTRFLSVYNVDYKLFSKILVTRLSPFLSHVLHPKQYGVPGAPPIYIILSQLRDLIRYTKLTPNSAQAIFTTDFTRAFDSVCLTYLYVILQELGFPPQFIKILRALFNSRLVSLKINGRLLSSFCMQRGLSQGCPLSSVLFSLALTPLMFTLSQRLSGITLHTHTLNVLSYIDDITYIIQDPSEVCSTFNLLHKFGNISQIKLNCAKSKILCFSDTLRVEYGKVCPIVDHISILGIQWFPTIQQTVKNNGDLLIRRAVAIMTKYKYLFHTLSHRIYFLNTYIFSALYYFLQILPFSSAQYALLNKYVGYTIWQNQFLRINRIVLYAPYHQGGLNLKDINLQGQALRLHRHLQLLCNYPNNFSYDFMLYVMYHIDLTAPLNIRPFHHIFPQLTDTYIELTYLHLQQKDFDDFTTQLIYRKLYERLPPSLSALPMKYPTHNWNTIFQNFIFLRRFPQIYDVWYQILYNVYPHNSKLCHLQIIPTDQCNYCQQPETMEHILTVCKNNHQIWKHYTSIVARILRTSSNLVTYDFMIKFPVIACFPSYKRQFLVWLTGHTIYFLLQRHEYHMATSYLYYLKFSLQAFSPDQLYKYFARYYTVLYD
jgi:hypothetical protein